MTPAAKPARAKALAIPLTVTAFSAVLPVRDAPDNRATTGQGYYHVPIIALKYSYSILTAAASGVGFLILLATTVFSWRVHRRTSRARPPTAANLGISIGIALGLLWMVEIGINNFVAPGLPARDIIDDVFWAIIALVMFALAIVCAYRGQSISVGIEVGLWSGLVSGARACGMALSMIVFGMRFLLQDPLAVAPLPCCRPVVGRVRHG
jgi:hypothetical protein